MIVRQIHVEGFGVWSGLRLDDLSDGLNVFYGRNEAGKTTLMQFVRAVLYGFGDSARQKYLPPVTGSSGGGTLTVDALHGRFRIHRRDLADQGGPASGTLTVSALEGQPAALPSLPTLLGGVDERTYRNVFAIGLHEMQELSTLGDSAAADLLFRLSSGLDRVSLVDVVRQLHEWRRRLLHERQPQGRLLELVAHRQRLQQDLESARQQDRGCFARIRQQQRLATEVRQVEDRLASLQHTMQTAHAAQSAAATWREYEQVCRQLEALGEVDELPPGAVDNFQNLSRRLKARLADFRACRARLAELRQQAQSLRIDKPLCRELSRIEALADSRPWLVALENQTAHLRSELNTLEEPHAAAASLPWKQLDPRRLAPLKPALREVRDASRRLAEARQHHAQQVQQVQQVHGELVQALGNRRQSDVARAVEEAGQQVSRLRQRVQLQSRSEELSRRCAGLEEELQHAQVQQMLPLRMLLPLGGIFALGVMLLLVAISAPLLALAIPGWPLAVLGLCISGTAVSAKWAAEHSARRRNDLVSRQLQTARSQREQAQRDIEQLDAQLPEGGGPLTARLQRAEEELQALEGLLPLEARRQALAQQAQAAAKALRQARRQRRLAVRHWRDTVRRLNLPQNLSPREARSLLADWQQAQQRHARAELFQHELEARRASLEALALRLDEIFQRSGRQPRGHKLQDRLDELTQAAAAQRQVLAQRRGLRREARRVKRHGHRLAEAVKRLAGRRMALLHRLGLVSTAELRQWASRFQQHQCLSLRRQQLREDLQRHVPATGSWADLEAMLRRGEAVVAEQQVEAHREHQQAQAQLRQLLEERGRLAEQVQQHLRDDTVRRLRWELATVEADLQAALRQWQRVSLCCLLLDSVREAYERTRQPATLRQASTYLARLTGGQYRRVWTPLAEEVLRVDDEQSRTLDVERLSRGAREQLFICLRLALVEHYAQRGIRLPVILDDVLVNFDTRRTEAAAALLCEFARAGHQVLLFTCHDHVVEIFGRLGIAPRELPDRDGRPPALRPSVPPPAFPEPQPLPSAPPEPNPSPVQRPHDAAEEPPRVTPPEETPRVEVAELPPPLPQETPATEPAPARRAPRGGASQRRSRRRSTPVLDDDMYRLAELGQAHHERP